jgi:CheY-like chemotaxis protein
MEYQVHTATDGLTGLHQFYTHSPDLVILDLMMPVMDGWEVVSEMDKDPMLAGVPVCVVSAQDRLAPPRNVCTLKKPVSLASLLSTVEQYCGKPG